MKNTKGTSDQILINYREQNNMHFSIICNGVIVIIINIINYHKLIQSTKFSDSRYT